MIWFSNNNRAMNLWKGAFCALLLLVFLPVATHANPAFGVIIGKVILADDGSDVPGVHVSLTGDGINTPITTITNEFGSYRFLGLQSGLYKITFSLEGMKTVILKDVRVEAGKTVQANIQMDVSTTSEEIVVSGQVPVLDRRGQHKKVFRPNDAPVFPAKSSSTEKVVVWKQDALSQVRPQFEPFKTNEFATAEENNVKKTAREPLSTFSIDVDTASYSIVRRILQVAQQIPGPGAVRIEELLNYFTYSYPTPDWRQSDTPFSVNIETGPCPWEKSHMLARIGIQGIKKPKSELPPSNLVFLLDVSGSMDQNDKLPLLLDCFRLLTMELEKQDKVSIVVYAGNSGLVLPPTTGNEKEKILEVLSRLRAGGTTAGGAGIKLAYDIACAELIPNGNNRVILATDGDFNVGVSSTDELVRLIEEKRKTGVFLTVLGFGMDNLKDSRMEQLADKGNGNYFYIDSLKEGKKVMSNGLLGNMYTIAKDVKIQVEFNPAYVTEYRLIGYENRKLETEDFENDQKDAGELGPGHSVTALYEWVPKNEAASRDVPALKYSEMKPKQDAERTGEMMTVKLRYKLPKEEKSRLIEAAVKAGISKEADCSDDFRFASAVAEWGLLLKNSPFKGNASYENILKRLQSIRGINENEQRREFAKLVEISGKLVSFAETSGQ